MAACLPLIRPGCSKVSRVVGNGGGVGGRRCGSGRRQKEVKKMCLCVDGETGKMDVRETREGNMIWI